MCFIQRNKTHSLRVLFLLFVLLQLQGCGGGSSGGGTPSVTDTTPNEFFFTEVLNASLNKEYISNSITIDGINSATSISIIGGEYAIDGGAFTSSNGTISNGQSIQVKQISSSSTASTSNVTLTIGGVSGIYSVTTFDQDIEPDTFTFTPQTDVSLNAVIISNAITVSGLNVAASIKVSSGDYYINDVLNAFDTVVNGDVVKVQVTASNLRNTPVTANLSIGNVSKPFTVTTVVGTISAITTPGILNLVESPTAVESTILVKLSSKPAGGSANVVFDVASSKTAVVTVSPASVTLTPQNWDTGVTVKVLAVNDNFANKGQFSDITLTINSTLTTDTSGYSALPVTSIRVNVTDDDNAGIVTETIAGVPTVNLNGVNEGVTKSFNVRLQSEPKKDVTLTVLSSNQAVASVSAATTTLTFKAKTNSIPSNWKNPQKVSFTAAIDGVFDSDKTVKLNVKVTSPNDTTGYVQPLNKIISATIVNINPPHTVSDGKSFLQFLNKSAPRNNEDAAAGAAYYAAVDPNSYRLTLAEFKAFNNGLSDAQNAVYVNDADLGFGRRMYLTTSPDGTVASCVENYTPKLNGQPNVNADAAEKLALATTGKPADIIATVCMEYSGTPGSVSGGGTTAGLLTGRKFVKFFSYAGDGSRITQADLDGQGLKTQPGLCNTCHGGQGNSLLADGSYPFKGNTGAHFLPWDLDTLVFDADPAQNLVVRDSYETILRDFNQGVLATYPQPKTFSFKGNVALPSGVTTQSVTKTSVTVSGVGLVTDFIFSIDNDGAGGPGVVIGDAYNFPTGFNLVTPKAPPTGFPNVYTSVGLFNNANVTTTGIKDLYNSDNAFGKYLDVVGGPAIVNGNITGNVIGDSDGYVNNAECVTGEVPQTGLGDISCIDPNGVWTLQATNGGPAGSLKAWSIHFNGIPDGAYLPASVELIRGWYGGLDATGKLNPNKFNGAFIPDGWKDINNPGAAASTEELYTKVIAPTCRACHVQRGTMADNDINFSSYSKFIKFADRIKSLVFDKGIMPMAKRTYDNHFWNSTKPDILAKHMPGYVVGQTLLKPGRNIANAGIARVGTLAVHAPDPALSEQPVTVKLNGSASLFPNKINGYLWTVTAPDASPVTVTSDPSELNLAINSSFKVIQEGTYKIQLDTSSNGTGSVLNGMLANTTVDALIAQKPVSFKGEIINYVSRANRTGINFVSSIMTCTSGRCHGGENYVDSLVRRTGRINFLRVPNDGVSLPTVNDQNENYRLIRDRTDILLPLDSLIIQKGLNKVSHGGLGRYEGSTGEMAIWSETNVITTVNPDVIGFKNYSTFLRWVLEGAKNN